MGRHNKAEAYLAKPRPLLYLNSIWLVYANTHTNINAEKHIPFASHLVLGRSILYGKSGDHENNFYIISIWAHKSQTRHWYKYTHTHLYIYIYACIYMCVCIQMCGPRYGCWASTKLWNSAYKTFTHERLQRLCQCICMCMRVIVSVVLCVRVQSTVWYCVGAFNARSLFMPLCA